jgi:hypothetical protein
MRGIQLRSQGDALIGLRARSSSVCLKGPPKGHPRSTTLVYPLVDSSPRVYEHCFSTETFCIPKRHGLSPRNSTKVFCSITTIARDARPITQWESKQEEEAGAGLKEEQRGTPQRED